MTATINLPTILRGHAGGNRTIEVSGRTVAEVFDRVSVTYPKLGEQLSSPDGGLPVFMNVFVDDEDIRYLHGLETAVGERTEITILPAVAGG